MIYYIKRKKEDLIIEDNTIEIDKNQSNCNNNSNKRNNMRNIDRVLSTMPNVIRSLKGKIDTLSVLSLPDEQSGIIFEKFIEKVIDHYIEKMKYSEIMHSLLEK